MTDLNIFYVAPFPFRKVTSIPNLPKEQIDLILKTVTEACFLWEYNKEEKILDLYEDSEEN